MPYNKANMTEEQLEAYREYLAQKKRESRDRMRTDGQCVIRYQGCKGKAKPGSSSCRNCANESKERDRERGWQPRPSRMIERRAVTLRRQENLPVFEILRDPVIVEYGGTRAAVSNVLRKYGLL